MYLNEIYDPKPSEMAPEKVYGIVYLIENIENGRLYVGKKVLWFRGYKSVKLKNGKKKRKKILVESDWREYYGSNNELKKDIEKFGKDKFKRTILHTCISKGVCSYLEMKEQVERGAIIDELYYNEQIRCRVHRSHLKSLSL